MRPSENQAFFIVTYLLLFLVGFCGNVTVFVFLIKLRYRPSNFHKNMCLILLNLAVANLLTEICGSVSVLLNNFIEHSPSPEHNILCKIVTSQTLLWIFANISKFNLCFLAWERYKAATTPLDENNMNRTMIILVFGWISGALAYVPFIPFQVVMDGYCIEKFSNHTISMVIVVIDLILTFIFPFAFVFYTYDGMIKAIRKRVETMTFTSNAPQRVTRISMLIITSYLLCWAPNYLFYAIKVIMSKQGPSTDLALRITYIPAFCASASHPFIYAVLSKTYRDYMIKVYYDLRHMCKAKRRPTQRYGEPSSRSIRSKINTVDVLTKEQSSSGGQTSLPRVHLLFSTTCGTKESTRDTTTFIGS